MPKAVRYKANGKYLKNTMFSTVNSDFIGAYHGVPTDDIYDPELAAGEEARIIESHKQDFAIAFGIPAEEIECEVIAWDGKPESLPKEDEPDALERIPEEKREGYIVPVAILPTREERIASALQAAPLPTDIKAALAGVIAELLS